jgi:hypothetical protein
MITKEQAQLIVADLIRANVEYGFRYKYGEKAIPFPKVLEVIEIHVGKANK